MTTAEERRERARLRSERWRRAHGIMPRRKAARPWLAEGISRSTWYRRRKQARERQALTLVAKAREAVVDRLDWQMACPPVSKLGADLDHDMRPRRLHEETDILIRMMESDLASGGER